MLDILRLVNFAPKQIFAFIANTIKMIKKYLKDYCVGCGLCEAIGKAHCIEDEKGFYHPDTGDEKWLDAVCPSGGEQQGMMEFRKIWGRSKAIYYGWSSDPKVRRIASSGGVITEVSSWLLEKHKVEGVIHTCPNPEDQTKTISCISTNRNELIRRSGSRYAISHPLAILKALDRTKRYAFVGKPCDVATLNNFIKVQPEWKNIIIYTISFFCAGMPSQDAQSKLLEHLGCPKEKLKTLRYRGDGWPGYTTAIEYSDKEYRTDYATSWGKILGRDIMKMCRFCLDGIGETADISCGDAWYLTPDKKPNFSESKGRNVIFARTDLGEATIGSIIADGKIIVEPACVDDLKYIQTYQWDRRATMVDKRAGMKLMGRSFPKYKHSNMIQYGRLVPLRRHLRILGGIVKRVIIDRL